MSRGKHTEAQMIEALKQVEGGVRKKWAVSMACRSTRYMASISSETLATGRITTRIRKRLIG